MINSKFVESAPQILSDKKKQAKYIVNLPAIFMYMGQKDVYEADTASLDLYKPADTFMQIQAGGKEHSEGNNMFIGRQDELDILGECKYKNSAFSVSDVKNMKQKFHPKKENTTLYYWLFSKNGFTEDVAEAAGKQMLQLVTPDEIINGGGRNTALQTAHSRPPIYDS